MLIMRVIFYIAVFIMSAAFFVPSVFAAEDLFSVKPLIVDEKVKQRDILKKTVTLTNNTEKKISIYASVHNIDPETGDYVFADNTVADRATSLAHWIEITRGVIDLEPGEVRQIPYLIQVNYNAAPGVYHAVISFAPGTNRSDAESKLPRVPNLTINIDVDDNANERLQLGTFKPEKTFFSGNTASFSYLLENIGNRAVSPKGEIRIFNRKGEEVATLNANQEGASLLPDAVSKLDSEWESEGRFGRYKALLELEYGERQRGVVYDTVFFWIIPWKKILSIFLTLSVVLVVLSYILYGRYNSKRVPVHSDISTFDNGGSAAVATETQANNISNIKTQANLQSMKQEAVVPRVSSHLTQPKKISQATSVQNSIPGQTAQQTVLRRREPLRAVEPAVVNKQRPKTPSVQSVTVSARKRNTPPDGHIVDLKGV